MAKAYYSCHQCGEHCQVIGRNRRDADRLAAYRESQQAMCTDCRNKELAEKNEKAAQANRDGGLSTLEGSEKQIRWAETLRNQRIKEIDGIIEKMPRDHADYGSYLESMQWIENQLQSSWWIDNRLSPVDRLVKEVVELLSQVADIDLHDAELRAENTVYPEGFDDPSAVAEINLSVGAITVHYPTKCEGVRELLKFDFGFWWEETHWQKSLGVTDENPEDQVAEIGNKLLNMGIPVLIWNASVRSRAISGDYTPAHTRWVKWMTTPGKFAIQWARADDLYHEARQIPGSKWERPYVVVPIDQADEVQSFAECYDFRLTSGAQKALSQYQQVKHAAFIAKVSAPKKTTSVDKSIPKLDAAPVVQVPSDLLDND